MISDQHTVAQLSRFSSLSGGKALGKPEMREYLRVAKLTAKSDYQVAAAITGWIDSQTFAPSPAELRAIIDATPSHPPASHADCRECSGSGRRSFWALLTNEYWPDTGRLKRRRVEEIPVEGDPSLWLTQWPALAKQVDGRDKTVAMLSGWCRCDFGRRMREMTKARVD